MVAVTIEIFDGIQWLDCILVEAMEDGETRGANGPIGISYDTGYAGAHWDRKDALAVSATLPVRIDFERKDAWPCWLIDLLPQGFGRAQLLEQLELTGDGPALDWRALRYSRNPVGNLRVKSEPRERVQAVQGFTFDHIANRTPEFVQYLADAWVFLTGSSGVQGEWPKLLLAEGHDGLFYIDHQLPDDQVAKHWLAKFLIGHVMPEFKFILDVEYQYFDCLRFLGISTTRPEGIRRDASVLMVERFDRTVRDGTVIRYGQESLYSLGGKFGMRPTMSHNQACAAIRAYVTDPVEDIIEYVKRDVANLVLQNPDNHGRNTAFARTYDGQIRLTPAFDVAPMFKHPDGIARQMRWEDGDNASSPDWNTVLPQTGLDREGLNRLTHALAEMAPKLRKLAEYARGQRIPEEVVGRIERSSVIHADRLEALVPALNLERRAGGRPSI